VIVTQNKSVRIEPKQIVHNENEKEESRYLAKSLTVNRQLTQTTIQIKDYSRNKYIYSSLNILSNEESAS
jgi:hypothetical protein